MNNYVKVIAFLFYVSFVTSCGTVPTVGNTSLNNKMVDAAYHDNAEMVLDFLRKGASINYTNSSGYSPFLWSVSNKNIELVKVLIDNGANVHQQTVSKASALHLALLPSVEEPSKQTNNISGNSLYSLVKLLIKHGADINHQDENGSTPSFFAAGLNVDDDKVIKILQILSDSGADFAIENQFGFSAYDASDDVEIKKFIESRME